MIDPIDPINHAECGGGRPVVMDCRELERRAACFDELLAACEAALAELNEPLFPKSRDMAFGAMSRASTALRAAIARAKGGA